MLHVHSMFSENDSTHTPDEIVKYAKSLGEKNITLTDHGTLLGIDDFMEAGEKYGINTIPGIETYLENRAHLLLIAKDYVGFQAISRALRDAEEEKENAQQDKSKKKKPVPIMTEEILEHYFHGNEHVIATSACVSGPIAKILLVNYFLKKKAEKKLKKLDQLTIYHKQYENAYMLYKNAADKEKGLKKELTHWKQYTKKQYTDQLKKEKNAADTLEQQKTVQEKETKVALAYKQIQLLDKEIDTWKKSRKTYKKQVDTLKAKNDRYIQLKKQKIDYESEDAVYERAKSQLLKLKSIFPNFYVELQYHGLEMEQIAEPLLLRLAKETDTPIIASNDVHILRPEDAEARQIVRFNYFDRHEENVDRTLYMKTEEELMHGLCEILPKTDVQKAIENLQVLEECHVLFPEENHYPKCDIDLSFTELLEQAKGKIPEWNEDYESRLQREVQVITTMGYVDYHLVVRDYCEMIRKLGCVPKKELKNIPRDFSKLDDWLKKKGFRTGVGVGPGRGSAAGSLVCYLLGITNIDPLKYNLLFDRFLNPERVTMPDIDTDVKTSLRPIIIQYLKWKYGEKAVCSIMTKMKYAAKAAIRMVGRDRASELYPNDEEKRKKYLYQHSYPLSDVVQKGQTLAQAETNFAQVFSQDPEKKLLWNRAKLIEGKLSSTSVHAGGVVISDNGDINEYVPLSWREEKQVWAAQCDMVQVEKKGLLKMDLLGLLMLDCISDCLQIIERVRGKVIDINNIPFEDEVFREIYAKGNTNSIFQFESVGMKSMLRRFQPSCFEDLITLIAMFRPGPMDFIDNVIDVKHGKKPLKYETPELEPILKTTYGAIVFQEQVMQIFQSLAGYSLGQADLVRRAMSKKKEEKLKQERKAFIYGDSERKISGCVQNGICEKIANHLFDEMLDFAKYAFNKSHAAAYAVVSYQTAWLKYHYPAEYLCAMFSNKEVEEYQPIYEDCYRYGIEILPPDINQSCYEFTIEDEKIRYGFCGIKGVGEEDSVQGIITKRTKIRTEDSYASVHDFLEWNNTIKKNLLECLINAGCFDTFYRNREQLILDIKNDRIDDLIPADPAYNRQQELLLMGNVNSENPLRDYQNETAYGCIPFYALTPGKNCIMGYISQAEEKISKKGNKMTFLTLISKSGIGKVLFMRQDLSMYVNRVVKIKGTFEKGTFFGKEIFLQQPVETGHFIILDTVEKTRAVSEIMKNRNSEEQELRLRILFYYGKDEIRLEKPTVREFRVSQETIFKIYKKVQK